MLRAQTRGDLKALENKNARNEDERKSDQEFREQLPIFEVNKDFDPKKRILEVAMQLLSPTRMVYVNFTSLIYREVLKYSKVKSFYGKLLCKLFSQIRKILIKIKDPPCRMSIRGKSLLMPLSHQLPLYIANYPQYDMSISRIGNYVRKKYGYLAGIDIGANIGDTVSVCYGNENDRFLAIEANPHFFAYLTKNFGNSKNIRLLNILCSSSETKGSYSIDDRGGTATISKNQSGTFLTEKTLDLIIKENPEFRDANFLKIDTDGYDFLILEGAREYIRNNRPAILFESYPHKNDYYVQYFINTMNLFRELGYKSALVYDNFGYLFCHLDLYNPSQFKYPLFWQLTGKQYCFDILTMKEEDLCLFLNLEITHFINEMPENLLQRAARAAGEL